MIDLSAVAWLKGSWTCEKWGGQWQEIWSEPNADGLIGCGRHQIGGKTNFVEFMSIEPADGGYDLWMALGALRSGDKKPVSFRAEELSAECARFVRESKEFPQSIEYRPESPSGIGCVLSGQDGTSQRIETFSFRRDHTTV